MAATQPRSTDDERAVVEPFARQLLELAHGTDPEATYALAPPIDPGIWIMHLYVRGDLAGDPDFTEALAARTTDILVEHNVGIATLFHNRDAAPKATAPAAAVQSH